MISQQYCVSGGTEGFFDHLTKEQIRNKERTLHVFGRCGMLSFLEDAAELASLSCFLALIAIVARGSGLA
ncbi:hypothetical protein [Methylovirgula ligni]|nr:hypothetical protein [Methylovirgula ligni]